MRPPGDAGPPSQGKYGLASIVCSVASIVLLGCGCVPLFGLFASPLALLASLAGIVLGVLAIVDGGKRGDSTERVKGIAGIAIGLTLPLLSVVFLLVFSRNIRQLFDLSRQAHGPAHVARDGGAAGGGDEQPGAGESADEAPTRKVKSKPPLGGPPPPDVGAGAAPPEK
ncbi:MAG: hypothetical protein AB1938_07435 [Myxococcota bacterium]